MSSSTETVDKVREIGIVELGALIDDCLLTNPDSEVLDSTNEWKEQDPSKSTINKAIEQCWEDSSHHSSITALLGKVQELENKKNEIEDIFSKCFSDLEEFTKSDVGAVEVSISSDSSDDDVQFISTSFDPSKAKQQQQKQQQQQKMQQQQQFLQQQQQQILQHQQQQPQQQPQQLLQQQGGIITPPQLQQLMKQPGAMGLLGSGQLSFNTVQNGANVAFQYAPQNLHQFQTTPTVPAAAPPATQGQIMKRPAMPRPVQSVPTPPPRLVVGMKIFAKKHTEIWYKGAVVEITNEDKPKFERRYKVKFDIKGVKVIPGKLIALPDPPSEILPVGTRIIALYRSEDENHRAYYAGIVAEPPSLRNNHRYLTFFDDGYAQYCRHTEVHRVYEQSRNVWDDIHPDSQEFIKGYLQQYPERPMVRLQKGQIVKTEWKGKWWIARVTEVDASLVKMYFEADQRIEWIYRGSTRLEPLYTELANQEASKLAGKGRRHNLMKRDKRPVVEYYTGRDDSGVPKPEREEGTAGKRTPVARKSTAQKRQRDVKSPEKKTSASPDVEADVEEDVQGERVEVTSMLQQRTRNSFTPHMCGRRCLSSTVDDPEKFRGSNPLLIPQLCGWERQISRVKGTNKRCVLYRAPCGRRLRMMDEIDRYLHLAHSQMTMDLFCFDPVLHTDTEYVPVKTFCDIKDLSYGKETVPISCVNGIDRQYPDYVEYSNQRIPAKGVQLNLDKDYLVGCDCTDGCRDQSKCACIQRTLESSRVNHSTRVNHLAPYKYRRLRDHVVTGIYECNSKCKCDCRCSNRVAQNGLTLRLQVFKTEKRGWGLRCLDDIPAGGFICIYAGQLLTEQGANEDGQQYGDEYLAELDYIEVVERNKEGYESDVDMGDTDTEDEYRAEDDSDRSVVHKYDGKKTHWYDKTEKDRRKTVADLLDKEKKGGGVVVISDDEGSNQSTASEQSGQSHGRKDDRSSEVVKSEVEGIAGLIITEPTSLNVDNEDSDSDEESRKNEDKLRRSARAAAQSRFSNLPDPKSQQPLKNNEQEEKRTTGFKSTRHYFGEEFCYVMDAKSMGNLGRYLNHSCSPNVFVQNVFVDTHDLRFPWVSFFAGQFIRAGTELTWDYNYEVGSVPGKVLYCYCGSAECRGRLL